MATNARFSALPRCPLCGAHAHMAEVVTGYDGKAHYAVVCNGRGCRLSEIPRSPQCEGSEQAAIDVWAAYPRGDA